MTLNSHPEECAGEKHSVHAV